MNLFMIKICGKSITEIRRNFHVKYRKKKLQSILCFMRLRNSLLNKI